MGLAAGVFGVFDGHAGRACSQYMSREFPPRLLPRGWKAPLGERDGWVVRGVPRPPGDTPKQRLKWLFARSETSQGGGQRKRFAGGRAPPDCFRVSSEADSKVYGMGGEGYPPRDDTPEATMKSTVGKEDSRSETEFLAGGSAPLTLCVFPLEPIPKFTSLWERRGPAAGGGRGAPRRPPDPRAALQGAAHGGRDQQGELLTQKMSSSKVPPLRCYDFWPTKLSTHFFDCKTPVKKWN